MLLHIGPNRLLDQVSQQLILYLAATLPLQYTKYLLPGTPISKSSIGGRPRAMISGVVAPQKAIVDLLDEEPLEVEIATTLLYEHSHHSYRQIRQAVQVAGERRRREIIDLGLRHRGQARRDAARIPRGTAVPF